MSVLWLCVAKYLEIWVSVSHRGYFTHHNQRYVIKPLKSTDQEEHAILTYNQEELDLANHTCGVRNVGRKQGHIRTSRSLNSPEVSVDFLCHHFLLLSQQWYMIYRCVQQLLISVNPIIHLFLNLISLWGKKSSLQVFQSFRININHVILLFVKQEDFLQAEKYIDLFLVLDNAFVSMNCIWFLGS